MKSSAFAQMALIAGAIFGAAVISTTAKAAPFGPYAPYADDTAVVKMDFHTTGSMKLIGLASMTQQKLSGEKPAALEKAPPLEAPLYGSIPFAGKQYLFALDAPTSKAQTLYVDANGNGDLTDDPKPAWTLFQPPPGARPLANRQYQGSIELPLRVGSKTQLVAFDAFDTFKPGEAPAGLSYYPDYAYAGEVTLADKTYPAILNDFKATGDFSTPTPDGVPAQAPGVRLCIDLNGDSRYDPRSEFFDLAKPFNIAGKTWEVAGLKPDGSFKIVHSDKVVPVATPAPDPEAAAVKTGDKTLPFKAVKMDGKPVDFPGDYKGKLVMLDFWATWCGPCMGEVPGLVQAYHEYHPKGLEILGVSFDQPNSADLVKKVTADKGMTWPQVYEGKFWETTVGTQYGIHAIPSSFLIDGDTGMIVASGEAMLGEELVPTLKGALAKKAATAK